MVQVSEHSRKHDVRDVPLITEKDIDPALLHVDPMATGMPSNNQMRQWTLDRLLRNRWADDTLQQVPTAPRDTVVVTRHHTFERLHSSDADHTVKLARVRHQMDEVMSHPRDHALTVDVDSGTRHQFVADTLGQHLRETGQSPGVTLATFPDGLSPADAACAAMAHHGKQHARRGFKARESLKQIEKVETEINLGVTKTKFTVGQPSHGDSIVQALRVADMARVTQKATGKPVVLAVPDADRLDVNAQLLLQHATRSSGGALKVVMLRNASNADDSTMTDMPGRLVSIRAAADAPMQQSEGNYDSVAVSRNDPFRGKATAQVQTHVVTNGNRDMAAALNDGKHDQLMSLEARANLGRRPDLHPIYQHVVKSVATGRDNSAQQVDDQLAVLRAVDKEETKQFTRPRIGSMPAREFSEFWTAGTGLQNGRDATIVSMSHAARIPKERVEKAVRALHKHGLLRTVAVSDDLGHVPKAQRLQTTVPGFNQWASNWSV